MEIRITKESDALLCLLYKDYLSKRKDGVPKSQARIFGSSEDIHLNLTPKLSPADTDETCWELHRSGMVHCMGADAMAYLVQLTDEGVIYMENRFKDGLKEVLEYLGKIKDIIPFI
ncbi:hypothetical protein D3C76_222310 [compost metagenome]